LSRIVRAPGADWRPSAALETLRLRASLLARLRAWFVARGVLEVETPALSAAAVSDPNLHSIRATVRDRPAYLHTSPEFPMKRLLAAGSGAIYQVCRVFRDDECGRLHGPEFTLVEWYRPDLPLDGLMNEVEGLVATLAADHRALSPGLRMTYRAAFQRHAGVDPVRATAAELAAALASAGVEPPATVHEDSCGLRDLLLATVVEPALDPDRPTFIYDFPADQAALATIRRGPPPVAARFEMFLGGMEIANGFDELIDAVELRERCAADLEERRRRGLPRLPLDERLLAAVAAGLPPCSGVAMGFDRLVMWIAGLPDFPAAVSFDAERA
jgi:lysyl-tRNA synthetase class 2